MALSTSDLQGNLESSFLKQRDSDASNQLQAAQDMATAIVDYAKGASIVVAGTPPLIPAPPAVPIPDGSVIGQRAVINPAIAQAGQAVLFGQINQSFTLKDPTLALIGAAIMTYIATFTLFTIGGITCTGATVPTTPPIFAPLTAKGLDGGTIKECTGMLADIIHLTFSTAIFNGAVINPTTGAVIPGVLAPSIVM